MVGLLIGDEDGLSETMKYRGLRITVSGRTCRKILDVHGFNRDSEVMFNIDGSTGPSVLDGG